MSLKARPNSRGRIVGLVILVIGVVLASSGVLASTSIEVRGWIDQRVWEEELLPLWKLQHPDVDVNWVPPHGTLLEQLITTVAGGTPPDVFQLATEQVAQVVSLDLFWPLQDLVKVEPGLEDILDDIHPVLHEGLSIDGVLYFVPSGWNTQALLYNTNVFAAAGMETPSDDWTKDDFVSTAKKLTRDLSGDGVTDRFGTFVVPRFWNMMSWFFSAGNEFLTDDWKGSVVDQRSAVDALQFLQDLVWVDQVAPPIGYGEFGNEHSFMEGTTAIWPIHVGVAKFLDSQGFTDFGIADWFRWERKETVLGVDGYGVLRSSKNVDAAAKFLKFISDHQAQQIMEETQNLQNVRALRSVAQDAPRGERFYDTLHHARTLPSPLQFSVVEQEFVQWVEPLLANLISPQEASHQLHSKLEQILSR